MPNKYQDLIRDHIMPLRPWGPDAALWLMGYAVYAHAIDDIIDQDIPGDKRREQFILETFEFAETVYSNVFYIHHLDLLRPLVKMSSNAYMDAVQWEDDKEQWKIKVADGLRQQGNELTLAVAEIVGGTILRRELSLKLREISYWMHHDEQGEPV